MFCLRWWLPVFFLPFPATSPLLLLLFIVSYSLHTRPCMYCGAIIVALFISSCYWYKDVAPVQLDLSWLPFDATWLQKTLEWIGTTPSSAYPPAVVADGKCATCWVNVPFSKNVSLLDAMPRLLPDGALIKTAPRTIFLGIPGTKVGMTLDFSL
ncbi:hypothetical protein MCUN1_002835 [Malassezia cuniculi]|uniref:Uncharacterized protein n=1 Tax=Malassezia cuniculi TaxID=948313 RepID=A0AAF0EVL6_9BASI|nr:hypothetical protein MCUN1_002835 [Malassezia cuniculi]